MEDGNPIIHYRKIFRKQVVCYLENTSIVSETRNESHKSISENTTHMHKIHNDNGYYNMQLINAVSLSTHRDIELVSL